MTSPVKGSRLPAWRRLRHQRDFDRVYAARCRAGDQSLLVFADVGGERIGDFAASAMRPVSCVRDTGSS